MRIFDGNSYRDASDEEREIIEKCIKKANVIDYDDAVNAAIREKYTESQEFAILRQRDVKPEEYAVYNDYCEKCKLEIKAKIAEAGGETNANA